MISSTLRNTSSHAMASSLSISSHHYPSSLFSSTSSMPANRSLLNSLLNSALSRRRASSKSNPQNILRNGSSLFYSDNSSPKILRASTHSSNQLLHSLSAAPSSSSSTPPLSRLSSSSSSFISSSSPKFTRLKNKIRSDSNSFDKAVSSAPFFAQTVRSCSGESHASPEKFVITTPLYYVNATPHLGSAYTTIAADALARFERLRGKDVVFITGTDEHGEKIAMAAKSNNKHPKQHCDDISLEYKKLWKKLNISYDRFIRTTEEKHEKIVNDFFLRVHKNGDIYRSDYKGYYCIACEEYKDESELIESKCCSIHRSPCVERKEDNYFFSCSKYSDHIKNIFDPENKFIKPSFRANEMRNMIEEGARDFSISRSFVEWGITIPNDPSQTIYVWFDALLGYVSALLHETDEISLDNAIKKGWPASVHIIGKDILRFHSVYWPAMLISANIPLPKMVFAHGFITRDGLKMGKSLGNTIDPDALVDAYGPDAIRYFLLKGIDFGEDGDFTDKRFREICNANLANTIGNLAKRTLTLLKKNCDLTITLDTSSIHPDHPLRVLSSLKVDEARVQYSELSFSLACSSILEIGHGANLYMNEKQPWTMFKSSNDEDKISASNDLCIILEALRIIAITLSPVTPTFCLNILKQLGYTEEQFNSISWDDAKWGKLSKGQIMGEPNLLFARLEEDPILATASN